MKLTNRQLLGLLLVVTSSSGLGCSKKKDQAGGGSAAVVEGSGATPGSAAPATGGGTVKIDGSSTVFLISQAVAEDFDKAGKGAATVAMSGTGGGLQKFCRGELDVAGASRPIKPSEEEACTKAGLSYVELPVAYDGLAVVVNKEATWVDHLTVAELKAMWEPDSKINNWSQVRPGFPDKKLTLFGAGTDSGTYDYFTQAIVGKEHSSRGDYTSNEDDNILVTGVAGEGGALGFFGYAYYKENADKLKLVPIDDGVADNGAGPIAPSEVTVADGTYQPLARPLFVYVSTKALERASVANFAQFYLDHAAALSAEVGYIALPAKAYDLAKARLAAKKPGSVFAGKGSQIGVTIEKLLADEAK